MALFSLLQGEGEATEKKAENSIIKPLSTISVSVPYMKIRGRGHSLLAHRGSPCSSPSKK